MRDGAGIVLSPLSGAGDDDRDSGQPPSDELLDRLGIHAPNSGRYRFRAVIGRGGGGVVLKVWDTKLNRPLAMKVVLGRGEESPEGDTPRVDGRTLTRFVDEARIASQLNHPGIVPVHELGADESGRAFFTMKLVKGEDLATVFEHVRSGAHGWSQPRALGVLLRVCESLAFAHEKGVIHRDLKPANVMVGRHGEVYVMDWGLARVLGEPDVRDVRPNATGRPHASAVDSLRRPELDTPLDSPLLTMDGDVIGTPAYMSPEQARGEREAIGPRSDVYGVGAMLYELIAGQVPFVPAGARVSPYTVLMRVLEGPPRALAEVAPRAPLELVAICEKAMARDAAERYPTIQALAEDLRAFLERRVVAAFESGTWAESRKWLLRNRTLAAAIGLSLVAVAVGLTLTTLQKHRADALVELAAERQSRLREQQYVALVNSAGLALERGFGSQEVRRLLDAAPQELRGWEWDFLDAAIEDYRRSFGGARPARQIEYSPDGSLIASRTDDGIQCWDVDSGNLLANFEVPVLSDGEFAFSSDSSTLAVAAKDGRVLVWSVRDDRGPLWLDLAIGPASEPETSATDRKERQGPTRCSFRPDGRELLVWDSHGVRRWDAITGQSLGALGLDAGSERVAGCGYLERADSFSPTAVIEGKPELREGGYCVRFRAQDLDFSSPIAVGEAEAWNIDRVQFAGDNSRIVVLAGGRSAQVLSSGAQVWREVDLVEGERSAIDSLLSDDAELAVTLAGNQELFVRDLTSEAAARRLFAVEKPVALEAVSCNGRLVAVSDESQGVVIVEVDTDTQLRRLEGPLNDLSFSPGGTELVGSGLSGLMVEWDVCDARLSTIGGYERPVKAFAFTPDGREIVAISDSGGEGNLMGEVWRLVDGNCRLRFEVDGTQHGITWMSEAALVLSPDGRFSAVNGAYGRTLVFDLGDGAPVAVLNWIDDPPIQGDGSMVEEMYPVAFDGGSSRLATLRPSHGVGEVWDLSSKQMLRRLQYDFECDIGTYCAEGVGALVGIEWSERSGPALIDPLYGRAAEIGERLEGSEGPPWDGSVLAAHVDGRRSLAVVHSSRGVEVWDVGAGVRLIGFSQPSPLARSDGAIFDASGRWLLVFEHELGEAALVDLESRTIVPARVPEHEQWPVLALTADGKRVVTEPEYSVVKMIDLRTSQVVQSFQVKAFEWWGFQGPRSIQFSPDGSRLAIQSETGELRILDSQWYGGRYSERKDFEESRAIAVEWILARRANGSAWREILALLKTVDLPREVSDAASDEVSTRLNEIVREAACLVQALSEELFFQPDVITAIENDSALAVEVREEALRIASSVGGLSSVGLSWVAGERLSNPNGSPEDYDVARRAMATLKARDAFLDPADRWAWPAADYRCGAFDEAMEGLLALRASASEPCPRIELFLAMSAARLGLGTEAVDALDRARRAARNHQDGDDESLLRLIEEAESVVASSVPQSSR
ncbi:WD40 repeat domain-containing serine/threonine protein kinase [Engelhardtia mirabilis]|uniref:WD40 repeat domain-containing serine/threonine protein kinase n=1 Tax=Engelhardtia mirabilis TaxID=2528011 RepID=UPI003AF35F08